MEGCLGLRDPALALPAPGFSPCRRQEKEYVCAITHTHTHPWVWHRDGQETPLPTCVTLGPQDGKSPGPLGLGPTPDRSPSRVTTVAWRCRMELEGFSSLVKRRRPQKTRHPPLTGPLRGHFYHDPMYPCSLFLLLLCAPFSEVTLP